MSKLTWYVRRLGAMSPAEIGWRVVSAGHSATTGLRHRTSDARLLGTSEADWTAARDAFRMAAGRPVLLDRTRAAAIRAAHPESARQLIAAADRVVAGRVQYFGYPEVAVGRSIDWHRDPLSETRWPSVSSSRIDHRGAPGDAKWIWELNRLQHLPWLAQAWLMTGDDRYADTAWEHLDSWIDQNPPGIGMAWRGAFEAGIRAISVTVALQGLRDSSGLTPNRYRAVVRMLAESAQRCWADRSRFSSANNHLVGEMAGLAVVCLMVPELADSRRGLGRALRALADESARQILSDGAGAEQAFGYQVFTADLLLVVAALLRLGGHTPPPPITDALRRGAAHMAGLVGHGDPVPRFGDDDEGFGLRLDAADVPDVHSHLASVAAVTGDPTAARFGRRGLTSGWLGGGSPEPDAGGPVAVAGDMYAPDGGLVVLRSGRRRVIVDVGALGYLAIAAHGHADALAVTLTDDGVELIGDPGAGSYYGHPSWRKVHRSTKVHATVGVDGVDQSVAGGPFLWTRQASVVVHHVDLRAGLVDAEHDGYTRLSEPVRHRRWVVAPPDARTVLVVDLLSGSGRHEIRSAWPLHPDLELEIGGGPVHVATRAGVPVLRIQHAATLPLLRESVRGDVESGLGWWSRRLEAREPSWLVGALATGPVPIALATLIHTPGDTEGQPVDLTISMGERFLEISWREDTIRHEVTVDPLRKGRVDARSRRRNESPAGVEHQA